MPDKPNKQAIKSHREHRVARREAIAGFNYQPKAIGTRALDNSLKDKVNNDNTAKVNGGKSANTWTWCKRGNHNKHDNNGDRTCKSREPLHYLSEKWSSKVDNKEPVGKVINADDVTFRNVNQQKNKNC